MTDSQAQRTHGPRLIIIGLTVTGVAVAILIALVVRRDGLCTDPDIACVAPGGEGAAAVIVAIAGLIGALAGLLTALTGLFTVLRKSGPKAQPSPARKSGPKKQPPPARKSGPKKQRPTTN